MAEELATVTKKQIFGEIILYILTVSNSFRALKTGIQSDRGQNKCGITVNSEVIVITNPRLPSMIEADACKACAFTLGQGAKSVVCKIYRYNR